MGKRQRRRNRQQGGGKQPGRPSPRYLFPSSEAPLLEVHFEPDVSDQDKATCLAYWQFTEPGTWTHKVADIGPNTQVLRTVKASCHASLLTVLCPDCSAPQTLNSRSDMTATGLWRPDSFPLSEVTARSRCKECVAAETEARRQEKQQAEALQRKKIDEQAAKASEWIGNHQKAAFPEDLPSARDALALLTAVSIMERTGKESFGPLDKLDYTLGSSENADVETVKTLHQQRWLAPTLPATVADFAFTDDNAVRGVYVNRVPWRLAHSLGEAAEARRNAADHMRRLLLESPSELLEIAQDLDATTAVRYLDALLIRKYREDPIPEHRLQEAYDTFHTALQNGFTLGQLVAVAWSAAATSVAWGQRTPGLKPGSVAAASVTNLSRRIGFAKDRPVPEYDLPNWVSRPATHATAEQLLDQCGAEAEALHRFRSLQQRIASRALEAFELDGDLAESVDAESDDDWKRLSADEYVERLRLGQPEETRGEPITYALVAPDGSLEFLTESPRRMRDKVSLPGGGFVDRIFLEQPPTVNAYIGELVPASPDLANPVAEEMLRLLGSFDGPFFGPVSFFAVTTRTSRPQSLDAEQQALITAAHRVATARRISI